MMTHRASNRRGSFILDREFRGIGRIRRASGTTDRRTFKAIDAMLDRLYELGHLDTLAAIRDGRVKPLVAYARYRTGALDLIPGVQTADEIATGWATWQAATPVRSTRKGREFAWSKLAGVLRGNAMITDLPDALRALRTGLAHQPPAFNRTRAAALAFVRDQLGRSHPLYQHCTDVLGLRERVAKRPAPPIAKAIRVRAALGEAAADMWWSLYLSGMGPHEYDLAWSIDGERLRIPGTKRAARDRVIPLFGAVLRRAMGWKQFREALAALPSDLSVQPYDARRGFLHLLEEAGVTRIRRKMYAGHAIGDVTGGYERAELEAFFAQDRTAVLAKLALEEQGVDAARRTGLKRA